MKKYIAFTVAYIAVVYWLDKVPATANEWGDYFAGFVAPVALAWFIGTLSLQRKELGLQRDELALQRNEMKMTREVLEGQSDTQLKTAQATLEANKIAASTAFIDSVPLYQDALEERIDKLCRALPRKVPNRGKNWSTLTSLDGADGIAGYFKRFNKNGVVPHKSGISDDNLILISDYIEMFDHFFVKAKETGNEVHTYGSYHEAWAETKEFLGR